MSGDASVANGAADAADTALLTDAAEAAPEAGDTDTKPTESKPDAKASGDDGEKGEAKAEPDLLADDDDGKTPDKADGQADAKKDETPETYEAFTLPEGVQLDDKVLAQATPIFKDVGLSQDQAQKLVSLYAGMQQTAAEAQIAGFNQVKSDWQAQIKGDPEFGGDKLPKTLGAAKAVLAKYGDKALVNDLKEWGWANHPGLIRLLARVDANLSEDTLVNADATAQPGAKQRPEDILWPSMTQTQE